MSKPAFDFGHISSSIIIGSDPPYNLFVAPKSMSDQSVAPKYIWIKQAEEYKLKREAKKDATTKAILKGTFEAFMTSKTAKENVESMESNIDNDGCEKHDVVKPVGPIETSKCSAGGLRTVGGTACAPTIFMVTIMDERFGMFFGQTTENRISTKEAFASCYKL